MPAPAAGERQNREQPGKPTALPRPRLSAQWRRVQRLLDAGERRFVRGALRLQEARVEALTPLVRRTLQERLVPAEVPLLGELPDLVDRMARELLVDGIVHGDADVRAARHRASARGVELRGTDGRPVVPVEAIDFLQHRRDLTKYFDADQVANVRSILARALEEGATHAQTMDALKAALPGATRHRLEAIARTEATAAYNQGRLYRFLQSRGFIVAVQFMAVLDERTTDICRHRHGLVLRLDDPALRSNVPPLHYMCRSILSPIPAYELEEMGGQTLLERDRARLDAAPGPQVTKKGTFGNEPWPEAPGRRRRGDGPGEGAPPMPRPEPVRPVPAGGVAERLLPQPSPAGVERLPQSVPAGRSFPSLDVPGGAPERRTIRIDGETEEEQTEDVIRVGNHQVRIVGFRDPSDPLTPPGVDELGTVQEALEMVPERHIAGNGPTALPLIEVRITYNQIVTELQDGEEAVAQAMYNAEKGGVGPWIDASRIRLFGRDLPSRRRTVRVLLHEVGHHWFTYHSPAGMALELEAFAADRELKIGETKFPNFQEFYATAYEGYWSGWLATDDPGLYALLKRAFARELEDRPTPG